MHLDTYQNAVALFSPWNPAPASDNVEDVIQLILTDPALEPYLAQFPLPDSSKAQREWLTPCGR